ncbi:unnamed protein product [Orchesella dallaii]|uniref:Uncharacterized protein n=1 Tax=Orchesella dallaii TaxID=48710 RepID=A0ABP1QKJ9_9HEXA
MDPSLQLHPSSHQQVYMPPPLSGGRALVQPQSPRVSRRDKVLITTPRKLKQKKASVAEEEREEYIPNVPESFYNPNPGAHQFTVPIYQLNQGPPSVYGNTGFFEYPLPDKTPMSGSLEFSGQPSAIMMANYRPPPYHHGDYRVCAPVKDGIGFPAPLPLTSVEAVPDPIEPGTSDVCTNEEQRKGMERFNQNNELMTKILGDFKVNCEQGVPTQERLQRLQGLSEELINKIEEEKLAVEEARMSCASSKMSFMVSTAKFNADMKKLREPISQEELQAMEDKYYNEMKEQLKLNPSAILGPCDCEEENGCSTQKFELGDENQSKPFKISEEAFNAIYRYEVPSARLSYGHDLVFIPERKLRLNPYQPGSVPLATENQYYHQLQVYQPPPPPPIMQYSSREPNSSAALFQLEPLQASEQRKNPTHLSDNRQRKKRTTKKGMPSQKSNADEQQQAENKMGLARMDPQQDGKQDLGSENIQKGRAKRDKIPAGAGKHSTKFSKGVCHPNKPLHNTSIRLMSGGGIVEEKPSTSAAGIGPTPVVETGSEVTVGGNDGNGQQPSLSSVDMQVFEIPDLIEFLEKTIKDGTVVGNEGGNLDSLFDLVVGTQLAENVESRLDSGTNAVVINEGNDATGTVVQSECDAEKMTKRSDAE